jgi:hypothetical protein
VVTGEQCIKQMGKVSPLCFLNKDTPLTQQQKKDASSTLTSLKAKIEMTEQPTLATKRK